MRVVEFIKSQRPLKELFRTWNDDTVRRIVAGYVKNSNDTKIIVLADSVTDLD